MSKPMPNVPIPMAYLVHISDKNMDQLRHLRRNGHFETFKLGGLAMVAPDQVERLTIEGHIHMK